MRISAALLAIHEIEGSVTKVTTLLQSGERSNREPIIRCISIAPKPYSI